MGRIGIDVGGTHTDGVLIENNEIINKIKVLTYHENLFESLIDVFNKLTINFNGKLEKITLSSTLATNLIVEKKLPPTGLIISGGPGLKLEYLTIGDYSFIIEGAIDHRGREIRPLNLEKIGEIVDELTKNGIKTCAVATKFSVRNPSHELKIKEKIEPFFENVTCGHNISGNLNFPRRINTSYLNSAIFMENKKFITSIKDFLLKKKISSPIYFLKADGGTFILNDAYNKPIYTLLSGQSAGVIGIMSLIDIEEKCSCVIDIGGTSSDFSIFYKNLPLFEPEGIKIDEYLTNVRSIYTKSIGLGGDSLIKIEGEKIIIGPERKDVAIAFGGKYLTPTDVVLYLKGENKKAEKVIFDYAEKLKIRPKEFCENVMKIFANKIEETIKGIVKELNSKPVYTIKEIIEQEKFEINKIYLMGAPSYNFKEFLEKYLKIPMEVVPHYDVVNAIGVGVSKNTYELNLFADTTVGRLVISERDFSKSIDKKFNVNQSVKIIEEFFKGNDYEIVELLEFNVIKGFFTAGKTIRIKAQIKPGVEIYLK